MTCRYENLGKANTSHLAHRASYEEMFISFLESLKSRLCTPEWHKRWPVERVSYCKVANCNYEHHAPLQSSCCF